MARQVKARDRLDIQITLNDPFCRAVGWSSVSFVGSALFPHEGHDFLFKRGIPL